MSFRRRNGLVVVLACASGTPLFAAGEEIRHVPFSAPVEISATGEVVVGEFQGFGGALVETVRAQLAEIEFIPAHRDGVALESTMQLVGEVLLVPVNPEEYEIRLQDVAVHPRLVDSRPPDYPRDQLRAGNDGAVELQVRIGPDGQVIGSRTVSATHEDFEQAAKNVLASWRFVPPLPGEAFEVRVPFWFYEIGTASQPEHPTFDCSLDSDASYVAGQDGCISLVETTGMRIRRWP